MYGPRFNRFTRHVCGGFLLVLAGASVATAATVTPWVKAATAPLDWVDAIPSAAGYTFDGLGRLKPNDIEAFKIAHGASGAITATASTQLPVKAGGAIIDVTAKVDKIAVAKAIGSFASKIIVPLSIGSNLYTLGKELRVAFKSGPSGTIFYDENRSDQCDLSGLDGNNFCQGNGFSSGRVKGTPGATQCRVEYICDPGARSFYAGAAPLKTSIEEVPMTREEFENRIAEKSGWPDTSKLSDVFRDAIKAGEKVDAKPESVAGPASKQISKTTTTNAPTAANPSPTQTTQTTTANYTYNGPNVNVTTTTVTNTTNNAGDVIDNSTTTTEAAPEKQQEDPCKTNPDRVGCSELDTPTEEVKKDTKEVTYSKEEISWSAGAQCPPPWNFSVPGVSSGNFQMRYEPFCDVATRMKPFIVAGAAFVAMLIVMSGIKS